MIPPEKKEDDRTDNFFFFNLARGLLCQVRRPQQKTSERKVLDRKAWLAKKNFFIIDLSKKGKGEVNPTPHSCANFLQSLRALSILRKQNTINLVLPGAGQDKISRK